jgi:hypothetical protein
VVLLFVSQVNGGLAYFTLYFQVPVVTQKYRILLGSWSIIIWFISPVATVLGGLTAALTILTAYLPPRGLKQRYGIVSTPKRKKTDAFNSSFLATSFNGEIFHSPTFIAS